MKKRILAILIAVIILLVAAVPAAAITDGELDGEEHPYVGLMAAYDDAGKYIWRCSGTLLSPTVFLTAGHCTEAPAVHAEIWFYSSEEDIRANGWLEDVGQASGDVYTHPEYNPNFFIYRDVGVVLLDEPYSMDEYGTLPKVNQLDKLKTKRGLQTTYFTAVGYGLQRINPVFVEYDLNRRYATPSLIQINVPGFVGDFSLLLSNNHSTGGTCFGDSGGPNFLGDSNVVAGVTSFGINGNCAGTGGVFRMDRDYVLGWLCTFGVGDCK